MNDFAPSLSLPVEHRSSLMHALCESLARESPSALVQPWHCAELDRREVEEASDTKPGRPWRKVLDEIRAEVRKGA